MGRKNLLARGMTRRAFASSLFAAGLTLVFGPARAASPDPLSVPEKAIITKTVLIGDVTGGPEKESVALVEYLSGQKSEQTGVGLLLGVYSGPPESRRAVWTRDYNTALGGFVAGGSLALLDLDGDGRNEIVVQMHHHDEPGAVRVIGEILRESGGKFDVAWTGPMRVDTAGPSSPMPPAQRERYAREIDIEKTARTRGGMIFFNKKVSVAAGVAIEPPKVVEESFPLDLAGER